MTPSPTKLLVTLAVALLGSVEDRVECTRASFELAAEAECRWLGIVRAAAPTQPSRNPFHRAWRGFDRAAGRG